MHRVTAKFLPRLMIDDQKANRVRVCQELLHRSDEDENFLSRITTGEESWVYGYDIEAKVQSSQWVGQTSPRSKKARQVRSNVKVMLAVFYAKVVAYDEYLPQGSTVNQIPYIEVLKRLRDAVRRKKPKLWRSDNWFFHHDNAPAHLELGQTISQVLCLKLG
ncbi:uncharacterized protein LOC117170898 [Belonocnema kinseyi]|uniref:uncharacterized protein LOC117170898 n=1 Tax=Belonocnema kinseyi TaxID=2817044 RepID=UPI00143DE812|nr:uncharacterized protein LOC117170898 [Belonocnema kinseyi]